MSFLDGDRNPPNIPFPTMGGKHFWTDLAHEGGYTLQQNNLTKHCRILNEKNIRVAWGKEAAMRVKLRELTGTLQGVQYGDVIGIHRMNGLFDHYGVYESDTCVYEYAAAEGDGILSPDSICVRISTLEKFLGGSDHFFVLHFPEKYGSPAKVNVYTVGASAPATVAKVGKAATSAALTSGAVVASRTAAAAVGSTAMTGVTTVGSAALAGITFFPLGAPLLIALAPLLPQAAAVGRALSPDKRPAAAQQDYHLYTPQETIQRAKSRLGETKYNLAFNNCEHFAIWCKTGLHQSHQVDAVLNAVSAAVSAALRGSPL